MPADVEERATSRPDAGDLSIGIMAVLTFAWWFL